MKKIFFLLVIVIAVWGCSKKVTPTTATATTTEAKPVPANVNISAESIVAGESTYKAKCGRCHALPEVSNYTSEKWIGLIKWMAPKAKLDDTEKNNVLNFVQANAKKI